MRRVLLSVPGCAALTHTSPAHAAAAQTIPGRQQSVYEKARGFPEPGPEHERIYRGERPAKNPTADGPRDRAAAAQVREDFRRIQLLNNSLRALRPGARDYEQAVSKTAA